MASPNPLAGLKVDIWMPLDIGRFLQDTIHLNAQQIGSYMLLLMRYWGEGALPNDPESLAITARVSGDTWSKTQVVLSRYFQVASDGLLHQSGADRRRAAWIDKRLKAREKAIKAITARWSKHKAKLASTGDTPSKAGVIPENYPSPVVQEQKQKQELPPDPPPLRGRGTRGPAPAAGVLQASAGQAAAPNGRAIASTPAAPRRPVRGSPSSPAAAKSEQNEKPAKSPPGAIGNGLQHGYHQPINMRTVQQSGGAIAGHRGKRPEQGLASKMEGEVFAFWNAGEVKGYDCPWSAKEDRALEALLKSSPKLDLLHFKQLLKNRADSEAISRSDPPYKWLRSLVKYADGPLDRFGKPLRPRRTM